MANRQVLAYAASMAVLAALYLAFPGWHIVLWGTIGLASAGAVTVGIARHRPRRRGPWMLMAVAAVAFMAGDLTGIVLVEVLHRESTFPSAADAVYLLGFAPTLVGGLLWLTRSGVAVRDRASLIDALILTAGAALLSWIFLINPYLQSPDLTPVQKAIAVAYPAVDLLVLAIVVRLAISAVRTPAVFILVVAGLGLLVADVLYGLSQLGGAWQVGGVVDLGWIIFYIAWGAAALHPSMVTLTEPRVLRHTEVNTRRLVLGVASLIAPAVLLVEALRGEVTDGVVIALLSAVLVPLALARVSAVASGLRRTLARERELRLACETLLSTTTTAEVIDVMHAAVAQLLPPGTRHQVIVAVRDADRVVVAAASLDAEADPDEDESPTMTMTYARSLPEPFAERLAGFELALHYRLTVGARQVGDAFVAADEISLVGLQQALPVLAGQAATMLDHITLNRQINQRESEAYFRTLVLNAADVILIVDDANVVRYASPSAPTVFGTGELVGAPLLDLIDPDHAFTVSASLDRLRAGDSPSYLVAAGSPALLAAAGPADPDAPAPVADWLVRRGDGERRRVEMSARDLRADPTVGGVVLTLRDVTERRRLEEELLHRAYFDSLTGLANRTLFQERVAHAATRAAHTGEMAAVIVVNLDEFKVINDTMGHDAGDELLIAVGQRLVATLLPDGMVARLGADEFAVVLESRREVADVERVAEATMVAFDEPFLLSQGIVTTQVSIGVSTTADAADGHQLLSQADVALGMAKTSGKARWRRYEASLHTKLLERMQLRGELDQGIAGGQFVLNYQPIVELRSGRTLGFEALVRWNHPTRGLVPPDQFIQIAEESGMIVALGAWVLRTAVAAATRWRDLVPLDSPYVSVNVSARQFRSAGFIDLVHRELAQAGLPARFLILEITESLLLGDQAQVWADLSALREAGVRVSIDDFGTGYSSLSYLHQVPIDIVKLDKSFVDTIASSRQQLDLVTGIVALSHTLHLQVVAEGIETAEDRALLIDAGCGYGQGYFFARPMPEAAATESLLTTRILAAS